jgi:hypothetical protein
MRRAGLSLLLMTAPFALSCAQAVDPGATGGGGQPPSMPAPPADQPPGMPGPVAGQPPGAPPTVGVRPPGENPRDAGAGAGGNCDLVRAEAKRILQINCAICHQDPANQANFSFCLDVDKLATSVSSTGKKFVVPGAPEQSRLFERIASGEMPPAIVMQRPTASDVMMLRQWITSCVVLNAGGFGPLDAGVRPDVQPEPDPGPGTGKPGQRCSLANTCDSGGCCVLGFCRANGQACPGGRGGDFIPGTCTNGTCVTAGIPCGGVNQACCGVVRSCTAPQALCPEMAGNCKPCGTMGAACCKNGGLSSCLQGMQCVGNTMAEGTCALCGGMGQVCCGDGPVVRRTCTSPLVCQLTAGQVRCGPPPPTAP